MPFVALRTELWIADRLGEVGLFVGVTDAEERRERVRRIIRDKGVQEHTAGRAPNGLYETWAALFRRVYGCDL